MSTKKMNNKLKALFVITAFSFLTIGCSDDDNPVVNGDQSAKIEGRVTGNAGFSKVNSLHKTNGIEGATVTVAEIQSNGSLSTVSNTSVQTDVEGKFVVETNSVNEKHLVVVAEKASSEWKAVVSASTETGSTIYSPPLSDETTAEAEVYSQVVAQNNTGVISYADVQYYIDSEVAEEVKGNANSTSTIASALNAEAEAKGKAFSNAYFETSSSALQSINSAKADAQASLEVSLHSAGESQSGYDAAFESYQEAIVNAYVNAGIEKSKYAKIIGVSTKEMLRVSSSLSSEIRFALTKSAAKRKAYACSRGIEDEFDSAGASQSEKNAVVNARLALEASIDAAASVDEINAAFDAYHEAVVNQLKITLNAHTAAITSIDASINSVGGAKAILTASLAAAVSTDAVVNAYLNFYNSVKAFVETQLSAASSAEIEAATDIFIVANI